MSSCYRTGAVLAVAALLAACGTPMQHEGTRSLGDEHVFNRSYQLNVPKTVNVGEPMVKVEDYYAETSEEPVAKPTQSFVLKGGPVNLPYEAGREYPVRGRIAVDGVEYMVVANTPSTAGYQAALVRSDGSLHNRVVGMGPQLSGPVMVIYTMDPIAPEAKLIRERSRKVKTTKGFQNYELLYTGANANGINLTYREFSPEGLARVAFFQNLTYPSNAKSITFKQLRIAVDKASAEDITFTVVSDGLK